MKIYNYDKESGEFLSEGKARIDPMTSEQTEVLTWLLPANATFIEPSVIGEGFINLFDNEKQEWRAVADNRGNIYRKSDVFEAFHNKFGEDIPEGYTRLVPPEFPIWNEAEGKWDVDLVRKEAVEKEEMIGQEMYRLVRDMAEANLKAQGKL
jgi:hypothetical protein